MIENRDTFFARLDPLLAPSDLRTVKLAYMLAKHNHRSQVRKELGPDGLPIRYFEHCRGVAIILIDEVKIPDIELVIMTLVHDGPEDTRDLTHEMVEHCFGRRVAYGIKVLSKTPPEGYLDRFKMCSDWAPYIVKGCDRLHNLRSLSAGTLGFRAKQVKETRDKYYPLFDRMMTLVPDCYAERASWLRDAIRQETERQAALLELVTVTVP